MVEQVAVDRVEMVQSRAQLDMITIQEYAEAMGEGVVFPAIQVVREPGGFGDRPERLWCWDGSHRVLAARQAGVETLPAEVEEGERRLAVLRSVGANARHGLRRTDADKRRAVRMLLEDPEWGQWSSREIARRCQVSHPFVERLRGETGNVSSERTYVTGSGTRAVMDTARIGRGATKDEGRRTEDERPAPNALMQPGERVVPGSVRAVEPATRSATSTRPAAPVRPAPTPARPAPVMVEVEDPLPRVEPDVVLSVRIGPGEVLEARPVTVGIGREGEFPRLQKGVYGDLVLMVGDMLEAWFVDGAAVDMAAEVIAEG